MSLQDKIHCMKHNYKDCKWTYPEKDVKESIQTVQKKLKKINEEIDGIITNEDIDKILLEELGDKLTYKDGNGK